MELQNPLLHRYWFQVNENVSFGVTAYSLADAKTLLAQSGLPELLGWKIIGGVENIDLTTLENFRRHCVFGPPNWRGIWCSFSSLAPVKAYLGGGE